MTEPQNPSQKFKWLRSVMSVLASFAGVQSQKNADRDFKEGNASSYIVIGVILAAILIMLLIGVVKSVIPDNL